jgi:hypothetical protein
MNHQTMNMNMNSHSTNTAPADPLGQTPTPILLDHASQPASKPRSFQQLAASRRNGQKSFGPKTLAGRETARMNALKHGLFAKSVLVQGLNIRESRHEFSDLYRRFWDDLQPVGAVEEMLVDQIVTTHWRWRRALLAESGEIALSVDQGRQDRKSKPEFLLQEWKLAQNPIVRMKESVFGLWFLIDKLLKLRAGVEDTGELQPASVLALTEFLGDKPNSLARGVQALFLKLQENPEKLPEAALRERNQKLALAYLDKELNALETQKHACEAREAQEERSRQAASVLPSQPVLEKIIRYESKLERQLYRAMAQLERLQRTRQGEVVPPPLQVEIAA